MIFSPSLKNELMEKLINILNDLIRINHDRVAGYQNATEELKDTDADLKVLFLRYMEESRQFANELTGEVNRLGGKAADGTTNSGKVYRVWMDLKSAISGKDRKTVLNSCEFVEDAAQKAYDLTLNSEVNLEPSLRDLLVRQKVLLKNGHDEVKRLRDMQAANL
jgi:uncharacterized protein (TIGR02284 family)